MKKRLLRLMVMIVLIEAIIAQKTHNVFKDPKNTNGKIYFWHLDPFLYNIPII